MKKIIAVAAFILLLGGISYHLFARRTDEVKFKTEKVVITDIDSTVTATGTVNAVTTVLVGTQVSGTISELFADFNSHVKKGQLIAQVDPAPFEAQVEQAKANLLSARANLTRSEASLNDARRTMERNRQLVSRGLIAQGDFDSAETTHETAAAQVAASKAQVRQTEAALKLAETNLRYTRIVSPVNGTVISRNVDVGQTVAASFQTPTLFTIAEDLTKMQIDTSVDEADIGRIATGQRVAFTVDSYPDITFHGSVFQIRNAPIVSQNVVTYDVVVKVDNPELKLKPGMTANVNITVSSKKGVPAVPNAALRFKLPEKLSPEQPQKGFGIWILEKGKPRRVSITPGITDGNFTEIGQGELREGQDVIVETTGMKKEKSNNSSPMRFPR